MVSIHSYEENQFVLGLDSDPWIGGKRDPDSRDNWGWSDGTPWSYTYWQSGQPNDSGGDEDCARMKNNAGQWTDKKCSDTKTFVCKKGKDTFWGNL